MCSAPGVLDKTQLQQKQRNANQPHPLPSWVENTLDIACGAWLVSWARLCLPIVWVDRRVNILSSICNFMAAKLISYGFHIQWGIPVPCLRIHMFCCNVQMLKGCGSHSTCWHCTTDLSLARLHPYSMEVESGPCSYIQIHDCTNKPEYLCMYRTSLSIDVY